MTLCCEHQYHSVERLFRLNGKAQLSELYCTLTDFVGLIVQTDRCCLGVHLDYFTNLKGLIITRTKNFVMF